MTGLSFMLMAPHNQVKSIFHLFKLIFKGIPDAWAFLVLGEQYLPDGKSSLSVLGWHAQQVRYDPESPNFAGALKVGSHIAEREGMFFAALWRAHLNLNTPTIFRSNSSLTCKQSTGEIGALEVDLSFTLLRGIFQFLEVTLGPDAFEVEHIYGHNQDPWNEAVDWIAKAEAHKSHFLPRLNVDLRVWGKAIPFLWMLAGQQFGCPTFCGNGFDVHPPDFPSMRTPTSELRAPTSQQQQTEVSLCVSMACGNVSTLGIGSQGHAGKLDYIRDQFCAFHLNFLGAQETRTCSGQIVKDRLLRLCSGADGKNLGVEFWCNLSLPFAYVDGRPQFLQPRNFQVLHRDPRCLILVVQHEIWKAQFLVGHAPHSGFTLQTRHQWWNETSRILQECGVDHDLFVLMDANAPPGECDHCAVLGTGFSCGSGTPLLRQFLDVHSLCLPSTGPLHVGVPYTWTAPDGQGHHLIDFVAIPRHLFANCTWSQTLEQFDLNPSHDDHFAVGVELRWSYCLPLPKCGKDPAHFTCDRAAIAGAPLRPLLDSTGEQHWHTDVETHVSSVNKIFHNALQAHCPMKKNGPKKAFMTDALWSLRRVKLRLKKQVHSFHRTLGREFLISTFQAWKQHINTVTLEVSSLTAVCPSECSTRCRSLRIGAQLWRCGRDLKSQLHKAKKQVIADHLQRLPNLHSACEILRTVKPFMGSSNALKRGPLPLPFVLDENGLPCQTPEAALTRWIHFFMHMEGGERIDEDRQRQMWIHNLQSLATTHLDVPIQEVPTLVELEAAFRRVKRGKASGPDHLPSELFQCFPVDTAKHCYAILLKTALQGQECLLHKGGTLIPLWKGKGDMGLCSSFEAFCSAHTLEKLYTGHCA